MSEISSDLKDICVTGRGVRALIGAGFGFKIIGSGFGFNTT